ncbi:uncharacterized protein TNCV_2062561 [Trichonephila clavipes]|nr:uncharacterized protein TNCV_2062561 [Trichonephila clavipes]
MDVSAQKRLYFGKTYICVSANASAESWKVHELLLGSHKEIGVKKPVPSIEGNVRLAMVINSGPAVSSLVIILGSVDPRDNIYAKTSLKTLSTDQSLRRPPHRKKCTRTANCFISRHPGTQVAPSVGAPVSSRTIQRRLAEGHLGSWHPLRVLPLTPTHRRPRLDWCRARGNWNTVKWNQVVFSDESRFNLSSDDNCVRV